MSGGTRDEAFGTQLAIKVLIRHKWSISRFNKCPVILTEKLASKDVKPADRLFCGLFCFLRPNKRFLDYDFSKAPHEIAPACGQSSYPGGKSILISVCLRYLSFRLLQH